MYTEREHACLAILKDVRRAVCQEHAARKGAQHDASQACPGAHFQGCAPQKRCLVAQDVVCQQQRS